MTKQEQIEEMAKVIDKAILIKCLLNNNGHCIDCKLFGKNTYDYQCQSLLVSTVLYDAGFRKTSTSDIASDTQDASKEGYIRGNIDGISLARKEAVKEIFTKLIEVAKNNDNKLSIGLLKAWAIEYDVEVKE